MASSSLNTKLYQKNSGSYVEVAGLQEVPDIGGKPEKIDTTTLSSTIKTSILGIRDPGELQFKFIFDNSLSTSNFRVLKGFETANTLVQYKIVYSDTSYAEFYAYCSVSVDSAKVNDAIKFTATLMTTTDFTWTNPA
jgi:hypothetical protein